LGDRLANWMSQQLADCAPRIRPTCCTCATAARSVAQSVAPG